MFLTVESRRLLVIGMITIILSITGLLNNFMAATWETWILMTGFGLSLVVFAAGYLVDREVYALVGSYVMAAILVLISMTAWLKMESVIVPTYVLAAIALPFIIAWTYQQKKWGLLIPAYVLLAIVPILYMDNVNEMVAENLVPAYVLTMIGLPFIVAYVFTRKMVWLIPGGTLLLIALSFVAVQLGIPNSLMTIGLPVAALLVGAFIILRAMMQNSDDREKI
jgi:hypothetical protein